MTTPDTPRDETTPLHPVTAEAAATVPAAPHPDALADQVFTDRPTTTWAPAQGTTATAVRPVEAAGAPAPPAREYVRGPAPFAIVLGLLGLVVAAATLFTEIVRIDVPWGDLGPWTVVGAGVLVLLVGGLGLRASRGQD